MNSFTVSYVLLLTTGTITFIESIRTHVPMIRHIFNLETCVSIVAAYFYGKFLEELDRPVIDWHKIRQLRYLDWAITTPMMLIVLCAALAYNLRRKVRFVPMMLILLLNYAMLGLGYLGESGSKSMAAFASFVSLFAMFGIIYQNYIRPQFSRINWILYLTYLILWSLYGVVYFMESRQWMWNILDVISKCLVGLGLWIYYTRIVV
jgi:hypothetical protein